ITLATKEKLELKIPEGEQIGWGDGLYFHNDYLVAITYSEIDEQTVLRVLKLHLSEDLEAIERVEELENNHPLFVNPTTGAIVDNWFFYVATAQFSKFDENGILAPWDELSDTIILKLKLEQ
ncbi:MAG: hypothetical protein MI741_16650, partial [Rhodospirillales bacterium]|nr:hypothetical protein [Rhodospirillales bacterium]